MIRILLVDDHPIVREGLAAVLSDEPDFKIVGQAESGERALLETERLRPSLVVMDIRLLGMNGIDACASITRRHPYTRVIMLTSFPNEGSMSNSFAAGARGFVLKDSNAALLRKAIRTVADGGVFADPRLAAKALALESNGRRTKGPFGLTRQEMLIVERLPRGLTNAEIGTELGIAANTVKTHLGNAFKKLKARDRSEAAAIALREGLA
jgi:DNA-binding NarL/FixJ family response regulator